MKAAEKSEAKTWKELDDKFRVGTYWEKVDTEVKVETKTEKLPEKKRIRVEDLSHNSSFSGNDQDEVSKENQPRNLFARGSIATTSVGKLVSKLDEETHTTQKPKAASHIVHENISVDKSKLLQNNPQKKRRRAAI
jgi:hypothetical protein